MPRRRLNLGWLKKPEVPANGVMSLVDHFRELRYRVIISVLAFLVATLIAFFFYNQLFSLLIRPYQEAVKLLHDAHPNLETKAINQGFVSPFMLWLKTCAITGLVCSAPVWLYQMWSFVSPGLHAHERKWAYLFAASATPLFLLGVVLAYWILPTGIAAMIGFTPDSVPIQNLVDINPFLDFMIVMMLVFGLAFLLPVFIVMLNAAGVVTAAWLARYRKVAIFMAFFIGAAATPSSDPFSMLALAIPLMFLYGGSEAICHLNDRRRARRAPKETP